MGVVLGQAKFENAPATFGVPTGTYGAHMKHTRADCLKWKVVYSDVWVGVDRFGRSGGQTEAPRGIWWGFCRRLSMTVTS